MKSDSGFPETLELYMPEGYFYFSGSDHEAG